MKLLNDDMVCLCERERGGREGGEGEIQSHNREIAADIHCMNPSHPPTHPHRHGITLPICTNTS